MGKLIKWKKEDWGILSENNDEARPSLVIAIGEKQSGGEKTYVKEEIYKDIMECICENNSFYKVYVNYNEHPKIVTYFNGNIVANNKYFEETKKKIMGLLKTMYAPDVIRAYLDFQKLNHHKDFMLSPAIEILRSRIKAASGEPDVVYQFMLLKPLVEEFVTGDLMKDKEETLMSLDDNEFREIIIAMASGNKFRSQKYSDLLNGYGEDGTRSIITNELIRRYLKGGA